jgi:putative Holliday junction resolvase
MTAPAARTVLSFDYGLRRIGVAVGNTLTGTAEALATIAAQDGAPDWRAIDRCVADWRPAAIVAGVPYNMAGRDARTPRRHCGSPMSSAVGTASRFTVWMKD